MRLDRERVETRFSAAAAPTTPEEDALAAKAEAARADSLWTAPLMHGESSMQLQPANVASLMDSK